MIDTSKSQASGSSHVHVSGIRKMKRKQPDPQKVFKEKKKRRHCSPTTMHVIFGDSLLVLTLSLTCCFPQLEAPVPIKLDISLIQHISPVLLISPVISGGSLAKCLTTPLLLGSAQQFSSLVSVQNILAEHVVIWEQTVQTPPIC